MALAIFDLDHTLLDGDSDHLWGEFIVRKGLVDGPDYQFKNDAFYQQYVEGVMDIFAYQRFCLEPLTRHSLPTLKAFHNEYMAELLPQTIKSQTPALIARHKQQGDDLIVITATNRFVAGPIVSHLGIPNLLATEPAYANDRLTGEIEGTPCYQEGKIVRLKQWLAATQYANTTEAEASIEALIDDLIAEAYFYSDSINDLPLLELVKHPIVVDGDQRLQAIAIERSWQSISLK